MTTSVNITNTGSVKATSFSLTPGACTQSTSAASHGTATDLCAQMTVAITSGGSTLYSGTLANLTARDRRAEQDRFDDGVTPPGPRSP